MKHLKLIVLTLTLIASSFVISCEKSNSPIDQFVEVLDETSAKVEKCTSLDELTNLQTNEAAMTIERENADYKLTDNDKKKLKKSMEKLLTVAFDKTLELQGLSEVGKEMKETQLKLMVEAVNQQIDKADTFGEIGGLK